MRRLRSKVGRHFGPPEDCGPHPRPLATRANRPLGILIFVGMGTAALLVGLDQRASATTPDERFNVRVLFAVGAVCFGFVLLALYANARIRIWLDDDGIGWYRLLRFRHIPWYDVIDIEITRRRDSNFGQLRWQRPTTYLLRLGFNTDSGEKRNLLPLEHTSQADAERSARAIAGRSRHRIRVFGPTKRSLF